MAPPITPWLVADRETESKTDKTHQGRPFKLLATKQARAGGSTSHFYVLGGAIYTNMSRRSNIFMGMPHGKKGRYYDILTAAKHTPNQIAWLARNKYLMAIYEFKPLTVDENGKFNVLHDNPNYAKMSEGYT